MYYKWRILKLLWTEYYMEYVFFEVFALIKHCCNRGKSSRLLKCLLNITFVYCLLTIVSVAIYGIENNSNDALYFFGSKFSSSYFFLYFI